MDKPCHLPLARLLAVSGFVLMTGSILYAVIFGNFFAEGAVLTAMPWGVVSLVDLYLGLLIFCAWVLWRESNIRTALLWSLSILILGNALSCLYLLRALYESKGDMADFFQGPKKR